VTTPPKLPLTQRIALALLLRPNSGPINERDLCFAAFRNIQRRSKDHASRAIHDLKVAGLLMKVDGGLTFTSAGYARAKAECEDLVEELIEATKPFRVEVYRRQTARVA
jgi:hypothetical protein